MSKEQVLDISWEAIIKIFITILALYFIYLTREVALWFFFGLATSVILDPAINFLRKLWVPKMIAILSVYLSIFGILGLLIYLTAPIFIIELKQFSSNLPDYFVKISPLLQSLGLDAAASFKEFTSFLLGGLEQSSKSVFQAVMAFFGGVSSAIFILTVALFLSMEGNGAEKFLILITPKKYENQISAFFKTSQKKVAGWFGARILACAFVGIACFIVFYIFNVKYAFLLALISGILNFVPYIGPVLTVIVMLVFTAVSSESWAIVAYVLIAFFIIQSIENFLLTPLLMKKMIDLPPVLVLISLLVGAKLFGFLGTIFAVPVFGIVYEFLKEFLEKRREEVSQID